jgi:hypothetical protein
MAKDKKWDLGNQPSKTDSRLKQQLLRAKKEVERQKNNLEKPTEGSYVEKNGNEDVEYEGLKNEPKTEQEE